MPLCETRLLDGRRRHDERPRCCRGPRTGPMRRVVGHLGDGHRRAARRAQPGMNAATIIRRRLGRVLRGNLARARREPRPPTTVAEPVRDDDVARPSSSPTIAQSSPHAVSPRFGTRTTPTSNAACATCRPRSTSTRAASTVPAPATVINVEIASPAADRAQTLPRRAGRRVAVAQRAVEVARCPARDRWRPARRRARRVRRSPATRSRPARVLRDVRRGLGHDERELPGVRLVEPGRDAATPAAARRASPTWLGSSMATVIPVSRSCRIRGLLPSRDHHAGALARPRADLELVHEPLRAAEPEPQPVTRRVVVRQRLLDVRDARAAVLERDAQSASRAVGRAARAQPPPPP